MFFRNVKVCQTTKGYKKFSDIISTLNVSSLVLLIVIKISS